MLCFVVSVLILTVSTSTSGAPTRNIIQIDDNWYQAHIRIELLRSYRGQLPMVAAFIHACVVFVGLVGMFAAVVGSVFAPRLIETVEDHDVFTIWANDTDDDCADPVERERLYLCLRAGGDYI